MHLKKRIKYLGFTLVEILIALGVVGIVASLVLPVVVKQYEDSQTIARVKKIYALLSNVTNQIVAEEGEISSWDWNTGNMTIDNIVDSYKKRLPFMTSCGYNVNTCYYETKWKSSNDQSYFTYFTGGGAYYNILKDGTYMKFRKCPDAGCSSAYLSNVTSKMEIIVNINGDTPPNKAGRDIFWFYLTSEKGIIYPNTSITAYCKAQGVTCSSRILREGAINY